MIIFNCSFLSYLTFILLFHLPLSLFGTEIFVSKMKSTRRCGSVYLGVVVLHGGEVCYVYEGYVGSAVV